MFHIYGLLIGVGVVVGAEVASRALARRGQDGGVVWEALWWIIFPGLVGARLYHVIDQWAYYRDRLALVPQVWLGGLGILGGLIGGVLGLLVFSFFHARRAEHKMEEVFFLMADVSALGVSLAQAFGRWGNYFNGELYGRRTELPWGITVPGLAGRYHPLFLYESVATLALFVILLAVYRRYGEGRGATFGSYLVGYGLIRVFLEAMRPEVWEVGGFAVAQIVSVVFIVLGIAIIARRRVPVRF